MSSFVVLFFSLLLLPNMVNANAFNLSLIPDIAIVKRADKVKGFTLGIWSENPQSGFALGLVNGSTGDSEGVSFGFLGNYSENYLGAQIGGVNWSKGHLSGAQVGIVNYSKKFTGFQVGLVNYAESVDSGIQIGLVNIIRNNTIWFSEFPVSLGPFFPFVNWRFE